MIAKELIKIARLLLSSNAEKEVERLLKVVLKRSPFANKAHAVGGYIRDELLDQYEAKDLDIVVEMRNGAEKLTKWLHQMFSESTHRPRQLGSGYPIWQLVFKDTTEHKGELYKTDGAAIEFADAQKEMFPDPTSRQRVTVPGTLEEDVERRDFTVNMLMKDLTTGEIKDLTGVSKSDLEKGILRGHPNVSLEKTFANDPLRMLRLIRFQAKYGWDIPLSVLKTVKKMSDRISIISGERIQEELVKIMKLGKLSKAVKLMKVVGLLRYVLPEIEDLSKTEQSPDHHAEGDVFRHTLMVLKNAKPTVDAQLSALLHDVGKPQVQEILGDKIRFIGHDDVGGEIAEAIMRRLKFDKNVIKRVRMMVEQHMRPLNLGDKPSGKALRKFIRKVGDGMVDGILDLAEADALGSLPPRNYIPELREQIEEIRRESPVSVKPVLDGREIMQLLGIKPGPQIGQITRWLQEKEDEYASRGMKLTLDEAKTLVRGEFGNKSNFSRREE